ncbi:MAG: N-acetylneuraminate synthase family protein [bacterium]
MSKTVQIGARLIGEKQPCYIVAEIGINHNGELSLAKKLIDAAVLAGADAVKFQKRTPEVCVPREQWDIKRETPWGLITYLEYRHRIEFDARAYAEIERYCKEKGVAWFASCWDEPSVDFLEQFNPVCYKIPSAALTDDELLKYAAGRGRPLIISTGMSTMEEIRHAVSLLDQKELIVCHSTSTYPCRPAELNLRMINTLQREFTCPIGYSGHDVGLSTTYASVVLGACLVERHITLDRAMWGTDQAASVEPHGFVRLVRDIRMTEAALGDGQKRVYASEVPAMRKLRRVGASIPPGDGG